MRITGKAKAVPIEEWVSIDSLKPWTKNPRKNAATVPEVMQSLIAFGWGRSLVVREDGRQVVVGHTALLAAKALPEKYEQATPEEREKWHPDAVLTATDFVVPARIKPMSAQHAELYAIADNRTNQTSEWDVPLVVDILEDFTPEDRLLSGFSAEEFEAFKIELENEEPGGTASQDNVPSLPTKARTRLGDVYLLGGHRLMCGDCREVKWPDGIRCVWTDPPYGVAYEGGVSGKLYEQTGQRVTQNRRITNDALTPEQLEKLLSGAFDRVLVACLKGASWYVAAPPGPLQLIFEQVLQARGVMRQSLIWKKQRANFGRSDYHYQHEPIFYGWRPGAAHRWYGGRKLTTLLEFDKPIKSEEHPTMKPVPLVAHCLKNSARKGELVGDPFLGSGTTLIAAEQLGMLAVGSELDPRYCDVIVDRWEKLTGKKAELEAGSPSRRGSVIPIARGRTAQKRK